MKRSLNMTQHHKSDFFASVIYKVTNVDVMLVNLNMHCKWSLNKPALLSTAIALVSSFAPASNMTKKSHRVLSMLE